MKDTLLTLNELLSAVDGKLLAGFDAAALEKDFCFRSVVTDSRFVSINSLFVPLIGEFQNGHKYVPQAVEAGASVIFVNENELEKSGNDFIELQKKSGCVFVAVKNTLYALQAAATAYVDKTCKNMIRVSITGSSGKTTTKEMLVSVCKAHFGDEAVAYTKGNFNSETGLPLSMFLIRGDEKIGIFEMGMNRKNEIGEISAVWKSQYGIITNIGNAHIGILGSRQNIADEKRKSFDYIPSAGAAFVPAEDDFANYCTQKVAGQIIRFGKNVPEAVSGVRFEKDLGLLGTKFAIDGVETWMHLPGDYNYQNALGVIALAKKLGIPASTIKAGLEEVSAMSGRMEVKESELKSGVNATVICDCYNANPDSMKRVIEFCRDIQIAGNKIFVLGDMKELGDKAFDAHKEIGELAAACGADLVILAGPEMKAARDAAAGGKCAVEYFENSGDEFFAAASKIILDNAKNESLILIKGSHSMELEKLIPQLVKEDAQ